MRKRKNMVREEMPGYGGAIVLYRAPDGTVSLNVRLEKETIWLNKKQMAELFATERSVITKHLRNIFKTGELGKISNVQKMHIAGSDKPVVFYNLDVAISIGYRVNSKRGTQFRIWATQVLRDHILKQLKEKFGGSDLFGREKDDSLRSSLSAVMQTFGGQDVYPSREEKAAHLLYFLVKNHSFVDGNKRIAAALFLWFLEKNGLLYRPDGSKRIADNALVAITLMLAESAPGQKDVLPRSMANLIADMSP